MPNIPQVLLDRLSWADNRIHNFERCFGDFVNTVTHEVVSEKDSDNNTQILRYKLKIPNELPTELGFLAGDCIHNLRSSLDNLIWYLGNREGLAKRYLDDLFFPICLSSDGFTKSLSKIDKLPQPAIDILRDLQPYQEYQGRSEPDLHPLRILHRLWNDDKHRTPVLILCFHKNTIISPVLREATQLPNGRMMWQSKWDNLAIHVGGSLYDGKEFASVTQGISEPEPQLNIRLAFQVSLDDGGEPERKSASQRLRDLHKFVSEEILVKFGLFFK